VLGGRRGSWGQRARRQCLGIAVTCETEPRSGTAQRPRRSRARLIPPLPNDHRRTEVLERDASAIRIALTGGASSSALLDSIFNIRFSPDRAWSHTPAESSGVGGDGARARKTQAPYLRTARGAREPRMPRSERTRRRAPPVAISRRAPPTYRARALSSPIPPLPSRDEHDVGRRR